MPERNIEREQVEWVFRLTGGELGDEPWAGNDYWYEGVPSYAGDDFIDDTGAVYRTVVMDALYSQAPDAIDEEGGQYVLKKVYSSSGATECPGHYDVDHAGEVTKEQCPLCEAEVGEQHGEIYLGDGWIEAVYMFERELDDEEN